MRSMLSTAAVLAACATAAPFDADQIRQALQSVADAKAKTYNCSVSIAFKNADYTVAAAAGVGDFSTGKTVTTDDSFAWGSGTKPLTGASILKLMSEGHFNLETPVHTVIDPILAQWATPDFPYKSLGDLWGQENVTGITLGMMLNMTSGIPDFDTAKGHGALTDSLRQDLYDHPSKQYSPFELVNFPWVVHQYRPCEDHGPHWHKCYSSTNFMLLGLILANRTQWDKFDQGSFLPDDLKSKFKFAVTGESPEDYSPVHGYDRTGYNMPEGQTNNKDIGNVDGVFAGWTASDLVGNPTAVAELTWAIYGPNPTVLPKEYSDLMASTALSRDYGLATFNLARDTGHPSPYGDAYGHLGATYGFQSQMVYFPELKFALAVATNIETNTQTQPKDALCFAYNGVASVLLNQQINCTFKKSSYYGSGCNCTSIVPPS